MLPQKEPEEARTVHAWSETPQGSTVTRVGCNQSCSEEPKLLPQGGWGLLFSSSFCLVFCCFYIKSLMPLVLHKTDQSGATSDMSVVMNYSARRSATFFQTLCNKMRVLEGIGISDRNQVVGLWSVTAAVALLNTRPDCSRCDSLGVVIFAIYERKLRDKQETHTGSDRQTTSSSASMSFIVTRMFRNGSCLLT